MAVNSNTLPPPSNQTTSFKRYRPALFAIVYIAVLFIILWIIKPTDLLFPVWSAVAFPLLVYAPFMMMNQRIDGRLKIGLIALLMLVLIPILGIENTFYLELITQIAIFAALAIGLNIVVGFAGLLDLGYVAFFAVGAYLWGVFTSTLPSTTTQTIFQTSGALASPDMFWVFLFLGVIAAAFVGVLLGLPVLRLRGDYLAIVTLGFGEMIRIFFSNLGNISSNPRVTINVTNGAQGLPGIAHPSLPAFTFDLVKSLSNVLGVNVPNNNALTYQLFFYFLVLAIGGVVAIVAGRMDNSPVGRAWTAIREDETAAVAMGVPRVRMKLLAFGMGASFAGAMGVVFAARQTFVSPESFSFIQSISILAIVIVGGMGSIRGVMFGAVVVTLLNLQVLKGFSTLINNLKNVNFVIPVINFAIKDWPNQLEPARYERLVFGLLLIVMMLIRPSGLLPASRRKFRLSKEPTEPVQTESDDSDSAAATTGA